MKKSLLFILFSLIISLSCNAQIRNLDDLLVVSKLSIKEMTDRYQNTWEIMPIEYDRTEEGDIIERYPFTFK